MLPPVHFCLQRASNEFENLTKNLQNAGIILEEKSPEEKWNIISEAAKDEVTSFINLLRTFITLMKSNNYSINDVVKFEETTITVYAETYEQAIRKVKKLKLPSLRTFDDVEENLKLTNVYEVHPYYYGRQGQDQGEFVFPINP